MTQRVERGSNGSRAEQSSAETIVSHAPVSGERLGSVPVMSTEQVRDVVSRARRAQAAWASVPIEKRGEHLLRFRDAIVDRTEEVVDLLSRETGKPRFEALLHEVAMTADMITYWAKAAPRILAPQERPLHLFKQRRTVITYVPRGVIGIIAPWNFPFGLIGRDVVTALVAGNAAVVKPSEVTPLICMKAKEIWDACGMPEDLLGMVTGYGATGAALIDAGIDMCVLTGSVATGRRVAAACGERLIPCVMELGGKAPLIACRDCDIERTARAIVGGGFAHSGQVCVSVERVYAHRDVYEPLLARSVELTKELRHGDPATEFCDIGGVTFERQIEVAEKHIADAVGNGAEIRAGGKRIVGAKQAFEPTILANCSHDCTVMTEEIFGPIVPFMRVSTNEEALALANQSHLGLNAYVFTEDPVRGRRLAERVEAGCVMINEVLLNGGITEAPFGGIKQSGFGRVMGEEGLRAMCNVRHLCLDRFKLPPKNPLAFPYTEKRYNWVLKATRAMFTSGGVFKRLRALF